MSSEAIARLRTQFETELSTNPTLYHQTDILRVRTEDWQIRRYLLEHPTDESQAFAALLRTLRWKASFGLHTRTDTHFPAELWHLNDIELYGRDKDGRLIQWGAIRNKRYFKEINLLAKQMVAHILERVDRAAGETGFVIVNDTNGAGLANVDLEMNKWNNAILEYYPQALKAMYVVDLPWLLNSIFKFCLNFYPANLRNTVHFIKSSQLLQYIDASAIPQGLNGDRVKRSYPADLVPLYKCAIELNLEEQFVDNFYKLYKLKREEDGAQKAVEA